MKALYSYHGGKAGLAEHLISLMPPHRVYVEPFFGSGAVFFAKSPGGHAIVNDVDGNIVNFLRVLRTRYEDLEHVCSLTPHSRDEFCAADLESEDIDDLERARRFWVRINQSFGKTLSPRTGWSWTTARNAPIPETVRNRVGRFGAAAERLMHATIENRPAVEMLAGMSLGTDAVIYADPPYVHDTRVQPDGYAHEMTDDDHRSLLVALTNTDACVILSGYASDLYDDTLTGWHRQTVAVVGYSSNARTSHRVTRTEVIWSNRPFHQQSLFDTGAAV